MKIRGRERCIAAKKSREDILYFVLFVDEAKFRVFKIEIGPNSKELINANQAHTRTKIITKNGNF